MANGNGDVILLGSDGSQQEGNDAEAARIAAANNLRVKLFIDNNDVTIAGHPSEYLKGFEMARTLEGHGLKVVSAQGEDLNSLYPAICEVINYDGPAAVVSNRKMATGIEGLESQISAHDVIKPGRDPHQYLGSTKDEGANRVIFGEAVNLVLDTLSKGEAIRRVMVIDSDLEGSTGLKSIHTKHLEVFVPSGVMERGNFSAAAGFSLEATESARDFSRSGISGMADNTCHFGLNYFFEDNGLMDAETTALYFPADGEQMKAVVKRIFFDKGLRVIFSIRSPVPYLLKDGSSDQLLYGEGYEFVPGKEEVIRRGSAGYVVSYGDMVFRSLDAVERLRKEGLDVGLINKSTLNIVDGETIKLYGSSPFVVVIEFKKSSYRL
ncbi:thiamine diphosphate-binding protein [Trichoderma compactum]